MQKNSVARYVSSELNTISAVLTKMAQETGEIERVAEALVAAYRSGKKMVLFGNGGSAADAQHLATELLGGFTDHARPSLPALALTTDTSALTAIGNDYDFETIFARQVEAMVNDGDVVFAISTSGNSANVLKGAEAAKRRGAVVVALTGGSGGRLKSICDLTVLVPSTETAHIQEAHISVGHILCAIVEKSLAGSL